MGTTVGSGNAFEAAQKTGAGMARASGAHERPGRRRLGGAGPWLRLFLGISGGAVAIAVALGLLVVLTTAAAQAQALPGDAGAGRGLADAQAQVQRLQSGHAGGMLLITREGPSVAPLQSTAARLVVTGNTLRGTLTQRFRNPHDEWVEGSYLFPLPEDAAVDHLRMKVADRIVEGRIAEKTAARRSFAKARAQGQRASLVEQQRPNAFTTRIANIAPGADIEIELVYQQTIALRDGAWQLRLPGVVAPRYSSPATTDDTVAPDGEIERFAATEGPERINRIAYDPTWQAPTLHQGTLLAGAQFGPDGDIPDNDMSQPLVAEGVAPLNPIRITVELDAGVPIVQPTSASHRLFVASRPGDRTGGGDQGSGIRYQIQTIASDEAHEPADRDFILEWSPAGTALPGATLRHERHGDSYYAMLVLAAPSLAVEPGDRLPREMTFVVDTSGSMGGESIEQARSALAFGLQRLQPGDWFNVIQFNNRHSSLFAAPRPVTPDRLRQARQYVNALRADGGTEMRGAVAQALSAPLAAGVLGQVVFITDGAVDYEDELLGLVQDRIGERRLFTVGIGSAPNGFFMRKAAQIGGGTFTFIGNTGEVERRMARLFEKIAHPMATGLALAMDGGVLAEPLELPRELYAGEPLVLAAKFTEMPRTMTLSGIAGLGVHARRWRIPVDLAAARHSGLHVLWARARIDSLSDLIRRARHTATPQDDLRKRVVDLALSHHLVSDYTSLVAVDLTPGRPAEAPLRHGEVPANLPAGWDREALTGQAAVAGQPQAALATIDQTAPATGGPTLAGTATPAPLQLLIGVLLLAVGFLLLLSRRGSRFIAAGARG